MKTIKVILVVGLSFMLSTSFSQIIVDPSGHVGINTSNTPFQANFGGPWIRFGGSTATSSDAFLIDLNSNNLKFYPQLGQGNGSLGLSSNFWGDLYSWHAYIDVLNTFTCITSNFVDNSDERLKKNIKNLSLDSKKFELLNPVSYEYIDTATIHNRPNKGISDNLGNCHFGFIAQEIQKIYPELVVADSKTGMLGLKSLDLIPLLVQELQRLKKDLALLDSKVLISQNKLKSAISEDISGTNLPCQLFQNAPNPFSTSTIIKYSLSNDITSASLLIFDMQGKLIQTEFLNGTGEGNITIHGSSLSPGMYIYALIANGKEIDTKRMILTK